MNQFILHLLPDFHHWKFNHCAVIHVFWHVFPMFALFVWHLPYRVVLFNVIYSILSCTKWKFEFIFHQIVKHCPLIFLKYILIEEIILVYMFIGFFGSFLPTAPQLQSSGSRWWTRRRLCIWIQGWPNLPATSGICVYHGGWSADYSSVATRDAGLYEAPVKVQRKDKEKHKKRIYLAVYWIMKVK